MTITPRFNPDHIWRSPLQPRYGNGIGLRRNWRECQLRRCYCKEPVPTQLDEIWCQFYPNDLIWRSTFQPHRLYLRDLQPHKETVWSALGRPYLMQTVLTTVRHVKSSLKWDCFGENSNWGFWWGEHLEKWRCAIRTATGNRSHGEESSIIAHGSETSL